MSAPSRSPATLDDFLALPEAARFHELLSAEIFPKATPTGEHGGAQSSLAGALVPAYQRRKGGPGGPGGWWIATEVEVLLDRRDVVRPDVLGWRRETCPTRPTGSPVTARPDWICEIVSPANANHDTVRKLRRYHEAAIPHYWLVDPRDETLTVLRWAEPGYVTVLRAERGETVRAEPFSEVTLAVGTLFGDDPD